MGSATFDDAGPGGVGELGDGHYEGGQGVSAFVA